ncbi:MULTISPECIES: hypothetical protein [unclassified Pseudomonas]|uniref:hypothetical protein n=1 Tax=unclassified Pseudomonas TaxID=196821 RepID=UPI0009187320|nr:MULTISPECIES: hypothetical protein [unclassified Pseudomonas]ROO34094.1 hypothetical protein BIV09_22155 [Pseudomonas sp. 7SR1]SFX54887.1 hypothetical protein SAMN03159442_02043 [Pseudomonas sp. NFACC47-1]SFX82150.1 hypothetical protein SAMN03159352_02249 [Pseudomonas sp. NFACC43]SIS26352.1 hypothetical protein SAMN05428955_4372 [Pseudomonas sp. 7SR1]
MPATTTPSTLRFQGRFPIFACSDFKGVPTSDGYVLPFGLTCATTIIRLVGTPGRANTRAQPLQHAA